MLAPTKTWALELDTLDSHQGKTLLRFTRYLYPHKTLEDAVYALVVKNLDEDAAKDQSLRKLLADGVANMDKTAKGNWLSADGARQFAEVKALAGTPFFEKVRSTAVVALYSNELAYAHFGYPGPKGATGYLHRGFNDLKWLVSPPASASGPVPN
ncbi:MAG TPA: tat (twin-arginine translocation) pathway signal sequence [Burkholderiaceae bacterium]|nr:tat (twin-arginine translocation) pathway signal sequence [Burkholderiaceae bacterium]